MRRLILIACLLVGVATSLRAEPLRVGWWPDPPYATGGVSPDGVWSSLAGALARDMGRDVEFIAQPSPMAAAQALLNGGVDVLLGAPELTYLPRSEVGAVAIHRVEFSRFSRSPNLQPLPEFGRRPIGLIHPVPRALMARVAQEDDIRIYTDEGAALAAVMLGEVRMLIAARDRVAAAIRDLGLSDQIDTTGPVEAIVPRFALWAANQPDIGRALRQQIEDGRLDGLRAQYGLRRPVGPLSADRVVTIAAPPIAGLTQVIGSDSPAPVSDMLHQIADLARWHLQVVPDDSDTVDLRLGFDDPEVPLGHVPFAEGSRAKAILSPVGWLAQAAQHITDPTMDRILIFETPSEALASLRLGGVSSVVAPVASLVAANRDGAGLTLRPAPFDGLPIGLSSPGDRPGLDEELTLALERMQQNGALDVLQRRLNGTQPFWTKGRIQALVLLLAVSVLCLLSAGVYLLGTRAGLARLRLQAKVIQSSQDALIIWSADGGILDWNRGAQRLFGFSRQAAIKTDPDSLLTCRYPLIRPGGEAHVWAVTADGREILIARRREEIVISGQVYFLDSCRDVTKEHRADVLEQLNETLRRSEADLKASNQDLTAFTYAASHDLRAPTNTMLMLVSELETSLADGDIDDARDLLEDVRFTAQSMQALTRDLLEFSAVSKSAPRAGPVSLEVVLAQVQRSLKAEMVASGAVIEVQGLPMVWANEGQMRHLMQNLVENAIKFRRPGVAPRLLLSGLPSRNGRVGFSIRDNGIGVPDQLRARIFKPFVRGEPNGARPGHGLGLALCRRIAVQSGGWIELASNDRVGAEFHVFLEMVQDDRIRAAG